MTPASHFKGLAARTLRSLFVYVHGTCAAAFSKSSESESESESE